MILFKCALSDNYIDVIMSALTSQIASASIVCTAVCLGADQRKHQSSASLAFMRGIHRWPVDSPHKGPVTRILSIWWRYRVFTQCAWERRWPAMPVTTPMLLPARSWERWDNPKTLLTTFYSTCPQMPQTMRSVGGTSKSMKVYGRWSARANA